MQSKQFVLGRFGVTLYANHFWSAAIVLSSWEDDDNRPTISSLLLVLFGLGIRLEFPGFLFPPCRHKVKPVSWDAPTIERLGRNWYWHYDRREWGVTISVPDAYWNILYGRQSDDSLTEQRVGGFIPFLDMSHVRHTLYDYSQYPTIVPIATNFAEESYDILRKSVDLVPKTLFAFNDFDGESVEVACYVSEREWRRGTKMFKWMHRFVTPVIQRSVDLSFNKGVGARKDSWKGGVLGHAVEILPGESIHDAFLRYSAAHNFTNIRPI